MWCLSRHPTTGTKFELGHCHLRPPGGAPSWAEEPPTLARSARAPEGLFSGVGSSPLPWPTLLSASFEVVLLLGAASGCSARRVGPPASLSPWQEKGPVGALQVGLSIPLSWLGILTVQLCSPAGLAAAWLPGLLGAGAMWWAPGQTGSACSFPGSVLGSSLEEPPGPSSGPSGLARRAGAVETTPPDSILKA